MSARRSGPLLLDARTAVTRFPGIGRYVSCLASELASRLSSGGLCLVVDPAARDPLPLPDCRRVLCRANVLNPMQGVRLRRAVAQAGPRVLLQPHFAAWQNPGRLPAALTVYDLIPLRFPASTHWVKRFWIHRRLGVAVRQAGVVLAISHTTRDDLLARFPLTPERVRVTPLAAGPGFYPHPPGQVDALRERLGLPQRYLLYVGTERVHKNVPMLLRAWDGLGAVREGVGLVLAGGGQGLAPWGVTRLGRVGEGDLPVLMSGALALVTASRWEGFGLPVVEAMACGTPVVCGRHSALAEVAEGAALWVNPLDESNLAAALTAMLTDSRLRSHLAEAGRARAATFSWAAVAAATWSVLDQLAERGP